MMAQEMLDDTLSIKEEIFDFVNEKSVELISMENVDETTNGDEAWNNTHTRAKGIDIYRLQAEQENVSKLSSLREKCMKLDINNMSAEELLTDFVNTHNQEAYNTFGLYVAQQLTSMPRQVALICQKNINDIIYEAEIEIRWPFEKRQENDTKQKETSDSTQENCQTLKKGVLAQRNYTDISLSSAQISQQDVQDVDKSSEEANFNHKDTNSCEFNSEINEILSSKFKDQKVTSPAGTIVTSATLDPTLPGLLRAASLDSSNECQVFSSLFQGLHLSINDLVLLFFGESDRINELYEPLRYAVRYSMLKAAEKSATILDESVSKIISDIKPHLMIPLVSVLVNEGINYTSTMQNFLRQHLTKIFSLVLNNAERTRFGASLVAGLNIFIGEFIALALLILTDGMEGLEILVRGIVESFMSNAGPFLSSTVSTTLMYLRSIKAQLTITANDVRHFIVRHPSPDVTNICHHPSQESNSGTISKELNWGDFLEDMEVEEISHTEQVLKNESNSINGESVNFQDSCHERESAQPKSRVSVLAINTERKRCVTETILGGTCVCSIPHQCKITKENDIQEPVEDLLCDIENNYLTFYSPSKEVRRSSTNNHSDEENNGKRKRIRRPCPYCSKFLKDLREHIIGVHSREPEVIKYEKIKNQKERRSFMSLLRKRGIALENEKRFGTGLSIILQRRNKSKKMNKCLNCGGYYANRGFFKHKEKCFGDMVVRGMGGISINSNVDCHERNAMENDLYLHDHFWVEIMNFLNKGDIFNVVVESKEIIICGNTLFKYLKDGNRSGRKGNQQVRNFMRNLGHIVKNFNSLPETRKEGVSYVLSDIYKCSQYENFKKAVISCIYKTTTENRSLFKEGARKRYEYSISDSIAALIEYYKSSVGEEAKRKVEHLSKFLVYFKSKKRDLFEVGSMSIRGRDRLAIIPIKKEYIDQITSYCDQKIKKLMENPSPDNFLEIRRAVLSRVSIFSGQKVSEVSSATLCQWNSAKMNDYMTDQYKILTNDEKHLIKTFRIVFNDENRSDTPMLISSHLFDAIDYLCDLKIRKEAKIPKENKFIFASFKSSIHCATAFNDIIHILTDSGLREHINNPQVRHLLSTQIAMCDFDDNLRKTFSKFIAFSNENIYQDSAELTSTKCVSPSLTENLDFSTEEEQTRKSQEEAIFQEDTSYDAKENCQTSDKDVCMQPHVNIGMSIAQTIQDDANSIDEKANSNHEEMNSNEVDSVNDSTSSMRLTMFKDRKDKNRRRTWLKKEDKIISNFFTDFITKKSSRYPDSNLIEKFLASKPVMVEISKLIVKKNLLRVKLNNLKRKHCLYKR